MPLDFVSKGGANIPVSKKPVPSTGKKTVDSLEPYAPNDTETMDYSSKGNGAGQQGTKESLPVSNSDN